MTSKLIQAQNVTLRRNRDGRTVVVEWTVSGTRLSECTSGLVAGRRLANALRSGAVRFTSALRRRYLSWDRKGEQLWVSIPA